MEAGARKAYVCVYTVYAKPSLLPDHFRFAVAVLNMETAIAVNMHDKKV